MTITTEDAIRAASSIARDVADGKLSPAALEAQAVAELRELVGTVVGEGDPVWPLQLQIARGVLALGGIEPDELSEWLAVGRQRAGVPLPAPVADHVAAEVVSLPSGPHRPASVALDAEAVAEPTPDPDAEPVPEAEPETAVPVVLERRSGGYDPMRGWGAAGRGFVV